MAKTSLRPALSLSADFNGSAQLQQFFATPYAGRFG